MRNITKILIVDIIQIIFNFTFGGLIIFAGFPLWADLLLTGAILTNTVISFIRLHKFNKHTIQLF